MIAVLRHAVPYLQMYRDKVFVVKVGGEAFASPKGADQLLEQVAVLHSLGIKTVVVHGGGVQADELAGRLDVAFEKIGGRRVTSEAMVAVMRLALHGDVQGSLLGAARRLKVDAVGLSGMDAGMVMAKRRDSQLGEVGDIEAVRTDVLLGLLENRILPLVSPLSGDSEGNWLNINADTVTAEIAVALGAEKVIFMTGAPGILHDVNDPNSLISAITLNELSELEASGALGGGMLPKAAAIGRCLTGGVPRAHVVSFANPDSLLIEVFTNEGSGTLITVGH